MHQTREAAVAGAFYPENSYTLATQIAHMLEQARAQHAGARVHPKALIVPHAGHMYSGPTAALAYAQLESGRATIRRVVMLGPVHRVAVRGLALPEADTFATPLGEVALDRAAVQTALACPKVVTSAQVHAGDHALEVQLPFLQTVLDHFTLVPLLVGDASPGEVEQVLEALWGGPETLIVVSSDLSHYLPYRIAQTIDSETVQTILDLNATLTHEEACGATPVNGLMLAARRHGLKPVLLGACNSGDTAGDKHRVVGYAAMAFNAATHAEQ